MDDVLTEEQRLLLDASTRLIGDMCTLERVRERVGDDPAFAASFRRRASELGWYSMLVPEELGGADISGNGVFDAALIGYHRGRMLQPGAFVGTNVVAYALAVAGTQGQREKILPALMSGETCAVWAGASSPGAATLELPATGEPTSGGYRLRGRYTFVEDPGPDGWLLATVRTDEGLTQFLLRTDAPGLDIVRLESLDITRRFVQVTLNDVIAPADALVGGVGAAAPLVDQLLALACVLTAAESVGAMDYDLSITVQYAKDRIAFGRPIGSFQAIKHLLADTSLILEMSKAIAVAASQRLGEEFAANGIPGADTYGLEAASMAKAFIGDCSIELAQNCFQVFGGIGFTWEHDQHLYLRRLTTDAAFFGDPAWHREHLCALSGL